MDEKTANSPSSRCAESQLPRWSRIVFAVGSVLVLTFVVGVIAFGAWLYFDLSSARFTVKLENQSVETVMWAKVVTPAGKALLDLGDVAPGATVEKSVRVYNDLGPVDFVAVHGDHGFNSPMTWVVLTDNGPFDHKLAVHERSIHFESYAGSKGTAKGDFKPADSGLRNP